jgi:CheY-like chemotaxis protein
MLLVNSNITILNFLQGLLEEDFDITFADCGVEAIHLMIQHSRQHFDVVLTSLELPIMSGYQLCDLIHRFTTSSPLNSLLSVNAL